jgi:LysR family hydrogen peroxide-inducible transcriptional activator
MELHQLRYLAAVVRTGNFSRAAELCHVSQPSLSQQIQKLERELGEPLLQRRRQGALPTPFGRRFYPRALAILREVETIREEADSFAGEAQGSLSVGVIPTVAPYLLPGLLKAALARFPGLAFQVSEDTTGNLLEAMRAGSLDAALLSLPIEGGEWESDILMEDELLAALPERHPLAARKGPVAIERMRSERLVLMKEAHCLSGQTLDVCRRAGFTPEVYIHSSQIETLVAMVGEGMGVSFVPAMARPFMEGRRVTFLPLKPKAFRTVALVRPRQSAPTRALECFREICRGQASAKSDRANPRSG